MTIPTSRKRTTAALAVALGIVGVFDPVTGTGSSRYTAVFVN
jgi:hypothetical protein